MMVAGETMAGTKKTSSFSNRLSDFIAGFEKPSGASGPEPASMKFHHMFVRDLHELITRDLTRQALKDFVNRDARDTMRFYARAVDLESIRQLPWHRRYLIASWKIFVALAHKLNPPRRIAFALAILLLVVGWFQFIVFRTGISAEGRSSGALWLVISFAIILILLFMELRDKLDLKGDLEVAREIQFGLVPSEPFDQDGISICYSMRPANTVGGDYYDIIPLDESRVAIVIGDVSGKGIPAALLMALLLGSLRTLTSAGLRGIELITKLNEYLSANIPVERLITLFYGELELASGSLIYINAGHNAPYLIKVGQPAERLAATSLILGFLANSPVEARETRIGPGENLLLFTDGITEAFNEKEEEYGEIRLAAFLKAHHGRSGKVLQFGETFRRHDPDVGDPTRLIGDTWQQEAVPKTEYAGSAIPFPDHDTFT
jgi:sigma-B regulation protein RsbU (phosphoserine phosphatase)